MKYSIAFSTITLAALPAFASILPRQLPPSPVQPVTDAVRTTAPHPPTRRDVPEINILNNAFNHEEEKFYGQPPKNHYGDDHKHKYDSEHEYGHERGHDYGRGDVLEREKERKVYYPDHSEHYGYREGKNIYTPEHYREGKNIYAPEHYRNRGYPINLEDTLEIITLKDFPNRKEEGNVYDVEGHKYAKDHERPSYYKHRGYPEHYGGGPYKRDFLDVNKLNRRDGPTDVEILNFALTLEHLEAAFYKQALAKYSKKAFKKAGHPEWTRGRFQQIAAHEATHVQFLTSAITAAGAKAVEACEYQFPDTDVNSFIDIAYALESVGVSAYNGAAAFINNKAYLTVAASILGVEARHSAWINSAAKKSNPWNTAFETPLDLNQVFSIASGFIKKCPESNPPLPVKAFPSLVVSGYAPGKRAQAEFDTKGQQQLFAAFLVGTGTIFTPIEPGKNEIDIPKELKGFVYVVITNNGEKVSDETTVAGPAILILPFGAEEKN